MVVRFSADDSVFLSFVMEILSLGDISSVVTVSYDPWSYSNFFSSSLFSFI